MKSKLSLLLLFFSSVTFAQMTKLSSFSSNKFLDSKVIFEDGKQDVWGYFLLYEKDQTDKNLFELEYVILDKNLNKVGSNTFSQMRTNFFLMNFVPKIKFLRKSGENIYFSIMDVTKSSENLILSVMEVCMIRKISLSDFSVSNPNCLVGEQPKIIEGNKYDLKELKDVKFLVPVKNVGFINFDDELSLTARIQIKMGYKDYKPYKGISFYDLDLNKKWYFSFDQNAKSKEYSDYKVIAVTQDDILMERKFNSKGYEGYIISYVLLDKQTGAKKFEFTPDDSANIYDVYDVKFDQNTIYLYASFHKKDKNAKKNIVHYDNLEGYCKIAFERATGKEISKKYFHWADIKKYLNIDEKGEVNDYGYIHPIDFKLLENGKTIVYAEGFKNGKSTKVLDAFVFEFDTDMKPLQFKKIDKVKNALSGFDAWGKSIEQFNGFDFMFSQQLTNDDYVFFYSDNEATKRNPKWVLGIVTYLEGHFYFQKFDLNTKTGKLYLAYGNKG